MPVSSIRDLSPAARDRHHLVIDVRSPGEFAADHIPGAVNLPVLSDDERAEVGALYVQTSRFLARRRGAALIAANIAGHLGFPPLAAAPPDFRPLVYCWRGGQRSGAMAAILGQIGWPVSQLDGGYKLWRARVVAALHAAAPVAHRLVLIDGPTGSGKTGLLAALAARGHQTLCLETLAAHRGSLFGGTGAEQPGQRLFETRLMDALDRADPARPLLLEAESSRIGSRAVPSALWSAMRAAPRIHLVSPIALRARHILGTYTDIAAKEADLCAAIARLPSHHSSKTKAHWADLVAAGELAELVRALLEAHYDPAYARSARAGPAPVATLAHRPTPDGISATADRVGALMDGIERGADPAAA